MKKWPALWWSDSREGGVIVAEEAWLQARSALSEVGGAAGGRWGANRYGHAQGVCCLSAVGIEPDIFTLAGLGNGFPVGDNV